MLSIPKYQRAYLCVTNTSPIPFCTLSFHEVGGGLVTCTKPLFFFLKPEVLNYISAACNQGFSVHPEDISVQYTKYLLCLVLDAFNLN